MRVESGSTVSLTNALVGVVELGSSKKVRLVIKSEVLHIATSIGHVSSSRGNLTSPEYLVSEYLVVNTWLIRAGRGYRGNIGVGVGQGHG